MNARQHLGAVLLLTALVRVAVIVPGFGTLNDPDNYLPIAASIAEGRGFCLDGVPTAYRPPLYPILLAPMVRILGGALPWGVAALHLGLALASVALTYRTARRWGYGPTRSAIAALIVGIDPVAAVQGRSVMTETLALMLVALGLLLASTTTRRGLFLAGLGFGLGALCRPSLLPGAWLTAAAFAWKGPGTLRARVVGAALMAAGMVVPIVPWAWRNARDLGEPIWTTTHGGYTLALANNPSYYDDVLNGPPGAVWTGPNQAEWFASVGRRTVGMTQGQADRTLRDAGLRMIRERPADFARASIARLGRFWGVAPSGAVYGTGLRVLTALWTIPLWLGFAAGLARPGAWSWPAIAAPMAILGLTAVHAVYWTDLRMRVPIVPAIAIVAAGAGVRRTPSHPDSYRKGDSKPDSPGQKATT